MEKKEVRYILTKNQIDSIVSFSAVARYRWFHSRVTLPLFVVGSVFAINVFTFSIQLRHEPLGYLHSVLILKGIVAIITILTGIIFLRIRKIDIYMKEAREEWNASMYQAHARYEIDQMVRDIEE